MGEEQHQGAMGKLEQLAEQKFGQTTLTSSERKLMRAVLKLKHPTPIIYPAVCGPNLDDDDSQNDPSKADKEWGTEREIRAEVIRWLCIDEKAKNEVDPRGIWVYGAKITGKLDLSFVNVPFPLELVHCRLIEDMRLYDAQIPLLVLQGIGCRG